MDLFDIITVPDPVLKTESPEVDRVDDNIQKQMDRMLETMYEAPGIGLAANQVGILNRVLVMDVTRRNEKDEKNPIFMVNPEIVWKSEEISIMEEGCLSIPQQYAEVERPAVVKVKYLDYNGQEQEGEFSELSSHCVQHEIDHLDGVLFIDYLSRVKRDMMVRRVQKLKKQGEIL